MREKLTIMSEGTRLDTARHEESFGVAFKQDRHGGLCIYRRSRAQTGRGNCDDGVSEKVNYCELH